MKESKAVFWLIFISLGLLAVHLILSSTYLTFIVLSYIVVLSISAFEILLLKVRNNNSWNKYLPYIVLSMSLLKMIVSILWIFFALHNGLITTQSVMPHFFIPYFLMLALTSTLMVKVIR